MVGTQMELFTAERRDPMACEHFAGYLLGKAVCKAHGGRTVTDCRASHWGDSPRCALEPLDNTPEAMARRVKWCEEHEVREER